MVQTGEIILVNMPFANLRWPNLGLSLLQAAVKARGFSCRVLYLNFDLAEQIGYDTYQWIADHFAFTLGGERLFAGAYFGRAPTTNEEYFTEVLSTVDPDFSSEEAREFCQVEKAVEKFLQRAASGYPWQEAAIVGFATTFQQTMPSLALARCIKKIHSGVTIVFGGAACEGQMGCTLAHQFPEIDYVFLGEADESFPKFVSWLLDPENRGPLPRGVVSRAMALSGRFSENERGRLPVLQSSPSYSETGIASWESMLVEDLNGLPYPDFDDYFERYAASPLGKHFEPVLFFEMSRGCWWGQKHHCAFCGLNGESMRYRSKSPQRILAELRYLTQRYPATRGCAADNILDFRAFQNLLPELEAAQLPFHFACELKANLTRAQVGQLLRAGLGAPQLGIETFDTELLRRIDKGAQGVQNLQTLKWFSEAGIPVEWNWLYGFPGETADTFTRLISLVPRIIHFAPPLGVGRVRMDRFSPFFEHPERFGMINPRASRAFRHVYPFPQEVLNGLAYYYEFDFVDGRDPAQDAPPLLAAISRWRELHPAARLLMRRDEEGTLLITDTRQEGFFRQMRLRGWEADLYVFCDTSRSAKAVHEWASSRQDVTADQCWEALARWEEKQILLRWDDRFLALAVWVPEQSGLYQAARKVEARIEHSLTRAHAGVRHVSLMGHEGQF